ncbi:hypothetical protein Tco_1148620 [Tanacetum coccineum]
MSFTSKLVADLAAIDTDISDEDQALLLLTYLPSSYDNFVKTLLYCQDTLKLEDVLATPNSRELQKMMEAKGDGGEGLYVRGRSGKRDMELGTDSAWSKSQERSSRLRCYICQSEEHLKRNCRSMTVVMYYWVMEGNVVYGGQSGLSKVFGEEDTTMSTYLVNRSPSLAIGFKTPIDMLGFLVGLLVLSKGCLNRLRTMGFNESGKYKKTFIGSGVADHVVGSQEVQTQDLIYYHPARDREQHSAWELFSYREDSNAAAFAVAAMEKIYTLESLTFNNTVACKVISKWKAGLKDDMNAQSDVYVLSNDDMVCHAGCKAKIWVTKGLLDKAKENVLGMEIVRDQSGNTLRVSQSRFYNEKLVQTFLEGHFILSLEDSLSGDYDVEKNDVAGYMTLTEAAKEATGLKGLAIESGFELKLVAGIATGALSKTILQHSDSPERQIVISQRFKVRFFRFEQLEKRSSYSVIRLRHNVVNAGKFQFDASVHRRPN